MDYRDLIKRNNRGVLFEERDNSVYSVTRFNNRITLVVGCSSKGVINCPILVVSPENFIEIFGDIDYSLERKGSFFHRTVLNMLRTGPVICVNLRLTDDEKDKLNWISLSASAAHPNGSTRTSPLSDFYDVSSGFWKRSMERIELQTKQTSADQKRLIHVVNMSDKPVSLLLFKADVPGFDVPFEDWYESKDLPAYVHPKELVSDYLVRVIAVEGRWNNYRELAGHPKWGKYFDRYGIIKEKVDSFLQNQEVQLVKKWTASLIPYFKDKNGRDLYFSSIINDDINETGIFVSYDLDSVETDYRNGLLDMSGDGLLRSGIGQIDYLSYKRNISDIFVLEERFMDTAGNSFGDAGAVDLDDRSVDYAEGYIHNVKFTPNLFSGIGNFADDSLVSPLLVDIDSYAVLNGKKVDLSKPPVHGLAVYTRLNPGYKFGYFLYLTEQGIRYHATSATTVEQNLTLPYVDNVREIALGYFIVTLDINGVLRSDFTPIALDTDGFISPFKRSLATSRTALADDYALDALNAIATASFPAKVHAYTLDVTAPAALDVTGIVAALASKTGKPVTPRYHQADIDEVIVQVYDAKEGVCVDLLKSSPTQRVLRFEGALVPNVFDYNQGRIYHLWYWLSNNLHEKDSLITTDNGVKTRIDWIEIGHDTYSRTVTLGFASAVPQGDNWGLFIDDIEFLLQGQNNGVLDPNHIGKDSGLFQSYLKGDINSGDPFFYSLGDEEDVEFVKVGTDNLIVIHEPSFLLYSGKLIVQGSKLNDTMFTVLSCAVVGVEVHVTVAEEVIAERVAQVSFYDADEVKKLDISYQDGKISASVEQLDADPVEFYNRSFNEDMQSEEWKRTLDVARVYTQNRIGVELNRYIDFVQIGYSLLAAPVVRTDNHAEVVRNTTRIVDVFASRDEPGILVIETDSAIDVTDHQTECIVPMHQWVSSLDFKVLEPFVLRREVLPDGTEAQQQRILSLLGTTTKMAQALTNERLEWRYLVDSFGLGLYSGSKQELAQLAEKRNGAIAFANFPSVRQLRHSTAPKFTTNGMLDTKLLLSGGSRLTSGGERFTLTPTSQSYIMYCAPYVKVVERGRPFLIPPASYVAGLYMLKFNAPEVLQPWTIMSGVENGRIVRIDGLEEVFDDDELIDLDTMGVTVITTYKNTAYHMYNQSTAAPIGSALRDAHTREALIELEGELRAALQNFQWKPITTYYERQMLEAVNAVCDKYKKAGALYEFANAIQLPATEKEEQIVYVNTYVEVVRGVKLLLARITVNATRSTN